jgi:hypothetical protein
LFIKNIADANTANHAVAAHTLNICAAARKAGLAITPARSIDVFRTISHVDMTSKDDYGLALRINLASTKEEEVIFDRVFNSYWNQTSDSEGGYILANSEMIKGSLDTGLSNEGHRDMVTESDSFSEADVARKANLRMRWDPLAPPLHKLIRELSKHLATRPSRRIQNAPHGDTVNIRRSIRKSVPFGMELMKLSRVTPKIRKTRIVLLCDVSGSMDVFNPFLLQLMFGIQKTLKNSRTLVFSTETNDITSLLRGQDVAEVLAKVSKTARHWSGGTNIAKALTAVNRNILVDGSARSTVLIVISDGYDSGDITSVKRELELAKRRTRSIVWINPMYGSSSFEVRAKTMKAAMPYIDEFLPAFNAQSLLKLVAGLKRLS